MDFPSKEARDAARPLLRPRGTGIGDLSRRVRRRMTLLLRAGLPERGGPIERSTSNSRTGASDTTTLGIPLREPMMHRPAWSGFNVEEVTYDTSRTLILEGELDTRSVPALEAAIGRYCSDETRALTLDLSRLTFIDSSGLWTILAAMRWCERQGRGFSLRPGPESVQQVFEVTGLIDVLPFRSVETPL